MFPSKPLIDLSNEFLPYNSDDTGILLITLGIWCIGWALFYVGRGSFNEAVSYTAFMLVLTPTLTIGFASGTLFWSLVLMTVINVGIWMYNELRSESSSTHTA